MGAWSHLCLAALAAAWRAFDSLTLAVGLLVIAFALAQAYSALIFFGYVPGAARDATNRRAYGEPLPTYEPELAAEPLLDRYERELTRRILRESLRYQRLHAMALGGEVDRSLL